MQRGARFAIFDIPFGAPCWAQRGRQKCGKTNALFIVFGGIALPCSMAFVLICIRSAPVPFMWDPNSTQNLLK
jgi:hypothetical protein